ncbi:MAG: polyhydroxyalkanoic acid system family protein [Myxococcota bacterium]|nr:polyhydroxyalkanoic acid system family protein [Myxococcota bacterium]
MAKIRIDEAHGLGSADAARAKVEPVEEKLKDKFGVTFHWAGNKAAIKGKGVSGEFRFDDERFAVDLKLNMLLTPMAGKIEESIRRAIERAMSDS